MSRSRSQGQKRAVHPRDPRQRTNGPFCCMTHCNALAANNVTQKQTGPFRHCRGDFDGLCTVYVWQNIFSSGSRRLWGIYQKKLYCKTVRDSTFAIRQTASSISQNLRVKESTICSEMMYWLVAWNSGITSVFAGELPCPALDL